MTSWHRWYRFSLNWGVKILHILTILAMSLTSLLSGIQPVKAQTQESNPLPPFIVLPAGWDLREENRISILGADYHVRIYNNFATATSTDELHDIPVVTKIDPYTGQEVPIEDDEERHAVMAYALRDYLLHAYGLWQWDDADGLRTTAALFAEAAEAFDPNNVDAGLWLFTSGKILLHLAISMIFGGGNAPTAIEYAGHLLSIGGDYLDHLKAVLSDPDLSSTEYVRSIQTIRDMEPEDQAAMEAVFQELGFDDSSGYLAAKYSSNIVEGAEKVAQIGEILEASHASHTVIDHTVWFKDGGVKREITIKSGPDFVALAGTGVNIGVDILANLEEFEETVRHSMKFGHMHAAVATFAARSAATDYERIEVADNPYDLEFYINRANLRLLRMNETVYEWFEGFAQYMQAVRDSSLEGKIISKQEISDAHSSANDWEEEYLNEVRRYLRDYADDLNYGWELGYPDFTIGNPQIVSSGVTPTQGAYIENFNFYVNVESGITTPPTFGQVNIEKDGSSTVYSLTYNGYTTQGDKYLHKFTFTKSGFPVGEYRYSFLLDGLDETNRAIFIVDSNPQAFDPSVNIIDPKNNSTVEGNVVIVASTLTGDIDSVKFYANGVLLCTDVEPGWSCSWNAQPGAEEYRPVKLKAQAEDTSGKVVTHEINVYVHNPNYNHPPSIVVTSPNNDEAYGNFIINWEDEDPDDAAVISLYYDDNSSGYDGTLIQNYINEDWTSDWWNWDISDLIGGEDYWVYAKIDDGNTVAYDYSNGPLIIKTLSSGSNLSVDSIELEEDIGADMDGVPDAGENLSLDVELINNSATRWCDINATLSTSTSGVYITDEDVRFYYADPGQTTVGGGDFEFFTNDSFDGTVTFDLELIYKNCDNDTPYVEDEVITFSLSPNDLTPPTIMDGPTESEISPDAARISWATDENSDSKVLYGPTTAFGSSAYVAEPVTAHSVPLRNLNPNQQYFYEVQSVDPSGNGPAIAQGEFTTTNLGNGLQVDEVLYPNKEDIFGLAFDDANNWLWLLVRNVSFTYDLVKYDPNTQTVLGIYPVNFMPEADDAARGLAYDGTYLWFADRSAELVYKVSTAGALVQQYPYGDDPSGLAWDGANLWISDQGTLKICKVDSSLVDIFCFDSPSTSPYDLAFDGTYLWHVDSNSNMLYKLSVTGTREGQYPLYGYIPVGLAYQTSGFFWVTLNASPHDLLGKINPVEDLSSPVIMGGPTAESSSGTTAVIRWQTDEPGHATVVYGLTASYEFTQTTTIVGKDHEIALTNLAPNQDYHYSACTQDLPGNEPTCSPDQTFTTAGQTQLNVRHSIYNNDDGNYGITIKDGYLWIYEDDDLLHKIDPVSGKHLDHLYLAIDDDGRGLAYDGSMFWNGEDDFYPDEMLVRFNPSNGNVDRTILSPSGSPRYISWDGTYLWVADTTSVYRVNSSNGSILSSFSFPPGNIYGLAASSSVLWIYTRTDNNIYRLDFSGSILGSYPAPMPLTTNSDLHWDNATSTLWVLDSRWRYQMEFSPTFAPVISKVLVNGQPEIITNSGSAVVIDAYEQFGRETYTATVTITSVTDDPGISNVEMTNLGSGHYQYIWNTAGQLSADDYQVEVRMTDGTYTDTDGLSRTPDARVILAPTLSAVGSQSMNAESVNGATWAGNELWVIRDIAADWQDRISRIDLNTGSPNLDCIALPDTAGVSSNPTGITWNGSYLYVANNYNNNEITRYNKSTCALLNRYNFPGEDPASITWDGSDFWVMDDEIFAMYKMNASGSFISKYPLPGIPRGVVWDGSHLWVNNLNTSLRAVNRSTGVDEAYYALNTSVSEITWDGAHLWGLESDTSLVRFGQKPDLALTDPFLDVQEELLPEDEEVVIQTIVYAHDIPTSGAIVRFYDGDPAIGGLQIGVDHPLGTVSPGTGALVTQIWTPVNLGAHQLYAVVDPDGVIDESFENNNKKSLGVTVFDLDPDPPVISDVEITGLSCRNDGFYHDDETILFTWQAEDIGSGVLETGLQINGSGYSGLVLVSNPCTGQYSDYPWGVVVSGFEEGFYPFTVSATDNSDETSTYKGTLQIVPGVVTVLNVFPSNGSADVDTSQKIGVQFENDIDLTSLGPDTFEITSTLGYQMFGLVAYNPAQKIVTYIPAGELNNDTTYTVTLNAGQTGIRDVYNNTLDTPVTWSFQTIPDTSPPLAMLNNTFSTPSGISDASVSTPVISGTIKLYGTVIDRNIDRYHIQVGEGSSPGEWESVAQYSEAASDSFLGSWNTTTYTNGLYTIQLIVTDTVGLVSTDSFMVEVNNPLMVNFNQESISVNEDSGTLDIHLGLNQDPGQTVSVKYQTSDATATVGSDYTSSNGTVTFNSGETSGVISIAIIDDLSDEPDETFTVELFDPNNMVLGERYQISITILDNDVVNELNKIYLPLLMK